MARVAAVVDQYYTGRTKIWLNNTLQHMAATAPEPAAAAELMDSAPGDQYTAVGGYDCNYQDIGKHPGLTVAALEKICDAVSSLAQYAVACDVASSTCVTDCLW